MIDAGGRLANWLEHRNVIEGLMSSEHMAWRSAALDLGLKVIIPCDLLFGNGARLVACVLLQRFGGKRGMAVDPSFEVLEPHAGALLAAGYGFAAVTIAPYERASFIEMLADWGWTGEPSRRPPWL